MKGLFIGLSTLDLIYLISSFPSSNQKIVALEQTFAAGGPATNAAITFNYLANQAILATVLGEHSLSNLIRTDLSSIKLIDLAPNYSESPAVSSIIVTQTTGERAVISLNATKIQASLAHFPENILADIDVILIDGHQMVASLAIAKKAKKYNIPVVIDGGSWKPRFEKVLPYVNYAICSANFYPPNCSNHQEVLTYLQNMGIPNIAITQGEKPIIYKCLGKIGQISIPAIKPVDTLGAGDILHGAFCHYILYYPFMQALTLAAEVASNSCLFFGTRQWMK
jgi:sugar/nucleoside kinase (ribokinase family)